MPLTGSLKQKAALKSIADNFINTYLTEQR